MLLVWHQSLFGLLGRVFRVLLSFFWVECSVLPQVTLPGTENSHDITLATVISWTWLTMLPVILAPLETLWVMHCAFMSIRLKLEITAPYPSSPSLMHWSEKIKTSQLRGLRAQGREHALTPALSSGDQRGRPGSRKWHHSSWLLSTSLLKDQCSISAWVTSREGR